MLVALSDGPNPMLHKQVEMFDLFRPARSNAGNLDAGRARGEYSPIKVPGKIEPVRLTDIKREK